MLVIIQNVAGLPVNELDPHSLGSLPDLLPYCLPGQCLITQFAKGIDAPNGLEFVTPNSLELAPNRIITPSAVPQPTDQLGQVFLDEIIQPPLNVHEAGDVDEHGIVCAHAAAYATRCRR